MKIEYRQKRIHKHLDDLESGDCFRVEDDYLNNFYMKISIIDKTAAEGSSTLCVNLTSGELENFSVNELVIPVKATLVLEDET